MKIINKDIKGITSSLESHFFRQGPPEFMGVLAWNEYDFDEYDRMRIVQIIERFLHDINFNVNNIFDPNMVNERFDGDSPNWLGSYRRMRSPGIITFYSKNLTGFYWFVIRELVSRNHVISAEMLKDIAKRVINKTLYHELFHHFTDFNRNYTDGRSHYNYLIEEALAVAFSRIYLGKEHYSSSLSTSFFEIAYRYTGLGYQDWVHYQNDSDFIEKLIEYADFPGVLSTANSRNVHEICRKFLESVVENPNVEMTIQ